MKKVILVLMMMGVAVPGVAGIYGKAEIGVPVGQTTYYTQGSEIEDYSDTFFTNIVLGYKTRFFNFLDYKIFAGIITWGNQEGFEPQGWPFEQIYGYGMTLGYKGIYVQYNHFCAHPVIYENNKYNNYVPDNKSWMSQMTAITIGYEFEIK
jgi:hypothetical protein